MSGFALKIIALVLMLIDHLGQFFPTVFPVWFHWLGRVSAPLFFFTMAWGFFYTRNRKSYLTRMYLFSVGMGLGSSVLLLIFDGQFFDLSNNVFSTLLLCGVLIALIESKEKALPHRTALIWGFVLQQLVGVVATASVLTLAPEWTPVVAALCPSLLMVEGGFVFVLMGLCFYFYRDRPKLFSVSYLCFCLLFLAPALIAPNPVYALFMEQYQWMMVFSLPLMLAYNGQRGRQMKYLFYVFYPAHIFILYVLSHYII